MHDCASKNQTHCRGGWNEKLVTPNPPRFILTLGKEFYRFLLAHFLKL